MASSAIELRGVRQNNLKNLDLDIPMRKLTVLTGLSGSGKSSLAFETLYAEGQRRYVESLSTYTRQFLEKMAKPDLESIRNVPPAIALEQKNTVLNSRSTVGTQTEIVDYLRVLFAKIGETRCVACGGQVLRISKESIAAWALRWGSGSRFLVLAPLEKGVATKAKAGRSKSKKGAKRPTPRAASETGAAGDSIPRGFEEVLKRHHAAGFGRIAFPEAESAGRGEPPLRRSEELALQESAELSIRRSEELSIRRSEELSIRKIDELAEDREAAAAAKRAWASGELRLVVDRFGENASREPEFAARLSAAVEQALSLSLGRVELYSPGRVPKIFKAGFACLECGKTHREPEPNLFSFNSPVGACGRCSGFGHTLELDEELVVPDPSKTLRNGAIDPLAKPSMSDWERDMLRFVERHGISVGTRYRQLTPDEKRLIWDGDPKDPSFQGIRGCFEELKKWKYKIHMRVFVRRYQSQVLCPDCRGARLGQESLAVRVGGKSIAEVLDLPIREACAWFRALPLDPASTRIAADIFSQVTRRLDLLEEVGVGYLTLSRLARTLSGGEFQRINLATQLGNGLCGTLYVLDEPSIGLHAADTGMMIRILRKLRDLGNTLVVVEHDLEVIRAADHLVELGPGAGRRGGELVAQGTPGELAANLESVTGRYLAPTGIRPDSPQVAARREPRPYPKRVLRITGCRENNLRGIDVEIPLERLVAVTGVSGSGKSTLVHQTLYRALARVFRTGSERCGVFDRLYGAEHLGGVALLDQSPIGRSSRSNPATYLKAWEEIRRIYANQVLSLRRGFGPQHFSFNVDGGRCPSCKGEGEITLDMHFMAEVKLPCEECEGKRFKASVLDIAYRGKNVDQLLRSTIDEAFELFRDYPVLVRKLGILREVGLGYLALGQSATTLSGGESQRLKIAATLDEATASRILYVFDEPTTGLHAEDTARLVGVLRDLVQARHTVLVIEHQLDVVASSDWVIDLGPGGGEGGGRVVGAGIPQALLACPDSLTGRALREQGYFPGPPERDVPAGLFA